MKKFKDKHFAAKIDRAVISRGAARLGMELRDLITETILGMRDVADEIGDMFGPMPAEVANLVDLEEVRLLAGRARIAAIHRKGADLVMTAERARAVEALFARCADPEVRRAGTVRVIDGQTVLWRLGEDRGAEGALGLLKKWLAGAPGGN